MPFDKLADKPIIEELDKDTTLLISQPEELENGELINTVKRVYPKTVIPGAITPDGGEIFNDYDSNQAISPFATSTGTDNLSGSRAFTILALDPENKTYTLDSVEGLEVGDVYSVHLDAQRENLGEITAIDTATNTVTVDVFFGEDEPNVRHQWSESPEPVLNKTADGKVDNGIDADGFDHEKNTFRIPAKPLVGTRKIGCATTTIGYSNKALSEGAFSGGSGNVSEGSYSTTLGWQNLAAFCSLAQGIFTKIKGFWSAGFGYDIKSTADVTFGAGEGLRIHSRNQAVLGMYNKIDKEGKYAFMLGNGTYDGDRKNAFEIDWKGNGTFAGDVKVLGRFVYAAGQILASENFVTGSVSGLEKRIQSDLGYRFNGTLAPEMHARIYRGEYLGDAVTDAQLTAIRDGSFANLFLGDYWELGGYRWRIVDIDYWYNTGSPKFTAHHLVIMPDNCIDWDVMNDSATTAQAYVGSKMYKSGLADAKEIISAAFPDMVLTHKECLVNAATGGTSSGNAIFDSTVELPSEIMMYGTNIRSSSLTTHSKTQLALFNIVPKRITNGDNCWLRDTTSATNFAYVRYDGVAGTAKANTQCGIRPVFCIG